MLNLLHRSKTWAIASIFITTALSAQQNKTLSSYSAPANIDLRNSWDIYATGSFIYWQASQENIEIGLISENAADNDDEPFATSYVNNAKITSPNFTFRPGFKVGLGANLNWDGWNTYAEYTQFHGSIRSDVKPLTASSLPGIPDGQYLYPNQGASVGGSGIIFNFLNANQSWSLKMDLLDLSLARAYYSGTKLTVRSFFGARGAWIRQHLSTFYGRSSSDVVAGNNATISNDSASWGIGPRVGFESNWMLGAGVRLIGNGSADILYTRYSLRFNQQIYSTTEITHIPIKSNASVSQRIDYLRPHFDLEMGFGWGTYLHNNAYHIDLSATYGFQVFWSQNVFRDFISANMPAKSLNPAGNLYVQGLTMNAQFDF